ncbi:hypothetical protein HELRODRAFT_159628 [Helobdella robusta]|uniref:Uncharacterized protein n=1 Tax=Helobdella robusta TaxID=6412 RepID=T1EP94_HELRO|nr:hypothetical protein HELRODRAFT_159628 [Helobdella robusta]ESO13033.1 hypothetical protein HELRODRAFT_159628 [Helobdella robusta]
MVTLEDVIDEIFHSDTNAHKPVNNNVFDPNIHFSNNELTSSIEKIKFNQFAVFHSSNQTTDKSGDGNDAEASLTPNMFKALKCFLATLPPFKPELISPVVLEKLLRRCAITKVRKPLGSSPSSSLTPDISIIIEDGSASQSVRAVNIVEMNRPMDGLVVVLEGKVEVEIGVERFVFIEGPFACFGLPVLQNAISSLSNSLPRSTPTTSAAAAGTTLKNLDAEVSQQHYIPDFTVRPMTEDVSYIKISCSTYVSSLQATLLKYIHEQGIYTADASNQISKESSFVMANNAQNLQNNFSRPLDILTDFHNRPANFFIGNYTFDNHHLMPSLSPPGYNYQHLDESQKLGVWTPYQSQPQQQPEDDARGWDVNQNILEKNSGSYQDKNDSCNEAESNMTGDDKDDEMDVGNVNDVIIAGSSPSAFDKDETDLQNDRINNIL